MYVGTYVSTKYFVESHIVFLSRMTGMTQYPEVSIKIQLSAVGKFKEHI